jgi:hypothetical protein
MNNEDQEFIDYEAFAQRMEKSYPKMYPVTGYGGFAIGKGWYPIVERLSSSIQQHIEFKNKKEEVCPQVVVQQVKEKFGGLRFYYDGGDEYISGLVSMAESWADIACETCGGIGKRRGGGWVRTLCDLHEAERNARMEEQAKKDGLEV